MAILYYLFLKPASLLPMGLLYLWSDACFVVLYYLIGYRKQVVRQNLKNSFPEKTEKELRAIERAFFRHLCDLMVEGIKLFSLRQGEVTKRLMCVNPELLQNIHNQGKSVVLIGGHYSNWEWYAAFANLHVPQETYAIYTPIRNAFLNRKMKQSRERFGLNMVHARQLASVYKKSLKEQVALIFATDQSPHNKHTAHWMTFLSQETGVMLGTEHFAKKGNHPVVYGELRKIRRGYYEVEYKLICDDPAGMEIGTITEAHTRELEATIRKEPAYWLWSHKRWKHKRPNDGSNG